MSLLASVAIKESQIGINNRDLSWTYLNQVYINSNDILCRIALSVRLTLSFGSMPQLSTLTRIVSPAVLTLRKGTIQYVPSPAYSDLKVASLCDSYLVKVPESADHDLIPVCGLERVHTCP